MIIKAGFYTWVKTISAITDILGTGDDIKFYKDKAPKGTSFPYVTFSFQNEETNHYLGGASGVAFPVLVIDVWVAEGDDATALSEAIRIALDGFSGSMGSVDVRRVHLSDRSELPMPPSDGSEVGRLRARSIYDFAIKQATS